MDGIVMEHLALSLSNDHSPRKKLIDEILYPLIKTDINGYPINVMVDSGSASSHMISKVVEDNNIPTFQRDIPLQIVGFGNKKSDPITHYAQTKLVGKNGQEISIRFNILKNTIVSELPGITSQILERFPHIADHRSDLTAPIPRGPQTVHAIIGLRDVVKIYNI